MAKDTKEKILKVALDCFASSGYDGTNLQEIADKVGIVKSALYRHFKSKEELFDTLINEVTNHYNKTFNAHNKQIKSCSELKKISLELINFTINDKTIIKIRKVFLTEQFKHKKINELASEHFNYQLVNTFTSIFEQMISNGSLKKYEPSILALEYSAPITSLIHLADRDPSMKKDALKQISDYIDHFIKVYGEK